MLCLFLLVITNTSIAQTISGTTYPFSNTSGISLETPTGATVLLGSGVDNVASSVVNIGFDFWFTGSRYTQFSVNDNGLMKLGSVAITNESVNAMASATNLPKIASYWDDLSTGTTGNVQYWVTGTAPNRKLVVQWFVTLPKLITGPANATFQAWLYESTGVIEYVYGAGMIADPTFYSIGIGNSATLFASVNTAFPFANYGSANDANTLTLVSGTKYTFTPLVPPAPTALTFPVVNSASMTVSWTNPGVTSAVGYVVYSSTDNITYNFVTQVGSGVNSAAISGLNAGTLYYYKVYAVTEGGFSSALTGSQSTNSTPLTGTKTIGTTGANYSSITAAISDIQTNGLSGAVILELQADYTTASETFPITISGIVTSAVNNLTIRPAASVSSLAISPAATFLQTFLFNGASYVTIDGRPGGTGLTKALTIANTAAGSIGTLFFQNDATHILIEYCTLTGIPGAAGGAVIGFSTTTGTLGNSNNTIDNCIITDGGASGIFNAIYSAGTVGKENKLNVISNNNISNFFNGGANFSAITLTTGNTDWTISGNSFFETIARADNQAKNVIYINNSGTNYVVKGNYIGGSAPLAAGTPWSDAGFNAAMGLNCIYLSAPGSNDTVSNNTITNFSLSSPSNASGAMYAINVSGGNVTVTNNTIGSSTAPISIAFTGSYGITGFMGISASATISGNVSNNTILGVTYTGGFQVLGGISTGGSAPTFTVNANLIGSTGAANNITTTSFIGIQNACSGTVNITNNLVANINSSSIGIYNTAGTAVITGNSIFNNAGTSLTGISHVTGTLAVTISNNVVYNNNITSSFTGISSTAGINTITSNTVKNLIGTATAITGINVAATLAGQTVSQNVIDSLITTSAGTVTSKGIAYSGPITGTNIVSRNFIHSFDCTAGLVASTITGIYDAAGTTTYQNNMIRLGIKPDGTSITIGLSIYGIYQQGGTADKFYFNSVYIGGTGVATGAVTNTTFAFYRNTNSTLCDVRDNIFVNARSNAAGLGKHYIIKITSTTDYTTPNLTLNNNIYYGAGTGFVFGLVNATDYTPFGAWKGLTNFDAASPFADPNYVTPTGTSALVNLNVQNPTPAEGNGILIPAVTDDYIGQLRASFTPTDIGANAGNFGSVLDFLPPVITYTALLNAGATGNRILTATITDQTGVPTTGLLQPRIYFKKMFAGTWFSTQGVLATGTGTNGTWNFTINTTTLGGVIAGTDSVYYYVIAQDIVATPNIGSNPGGVIATNVNTITTPPSAPNKYKVLLGLSGVVTVGTGGTYTSLTLTGGLFTALSTAVLTANVTVNIISDLTTETGAVMLGPILNDGSGVYTVTINPVGARTISGTGLSPALITVNGASGFIIDGLNTGGNSLVIANSGSYPAILFQVGASNNIIRKATIQGASAGGAVISFGSSSATQGCNNNTINNCIVTSTTSVASAFPAYGFYFYGNSSTIQGANNTIDHCTITNFTNTAIYCYYYYGAYTISNNEIYNAIPAGTSLTGMYFSNYYAIGTTNIFNNKIHDLNPTTTTGLGTIYGINYYQGSGTELYNVYNNLIYLDATVSNTALTIYGINMNGNSAANVYYNSIYIGGTGVTSGSSAGLAFVGNYAGPDRFTNNAVYNARSGGAGPHYGINCSELYGTFTSNYNDIYANGIGSMFGNWKGINYQTLAAWIAATNQDISSFSGNPGFTSATNLTPNAADPNSFNLNGNGLPIATYTVDYNGAARSVLVSTGPSDIGAFEFTPTATPNDAVQFGNIQVGNTTAYYIGGRLAGTIQWTGGTALPTSISFKYWAGVNPPSLTPVNYGTGYFAVVQTGGTNFTYNINLYYSPADINTISAEKNIILAKQDLGAWTPYTSVLDSVGKKVTINGLNSLSLFAFIDKNILSLTANLKVFLQGPFNVTSMKTTLDSLHLIPLTSDSAYSGATYGYTIRTVASVPANVVDWILVELRSGTAAATKVFSTTGFLKTDGTIVDTNGVSQLIINSVAPGSYYIVIRHRNHLAIMSAAPVALSGASALYDFTTAQTQAYGTNPMFALTGGAFAMVAGDANSDGQVTSTDFNIYYPKFLSAVTGYDPCDWNLDGQITSSDFNAYNPNFYNARSTQVPY
jgi:hypothetical protein